MSSFDAPGEATREQARSAGTVHPVPRWVAPSFVLLGLLTIPWIGYLMVTLPRSTTAVHYRAAWVGFDIGLVAALLCTGYQSWRGSARLAVAATAAATMLVVDAWFDVVTTPSGPDLYVSVALAVLVELPLAAVCLWIALHTEHLVERRIVHLARRAARAEAQVEAVREQAARERIGARLPRLRHRTGEARSAGAAGEIVRRWRRAAAHVPRSRTRTTAEAAALPEPDPAAPADGDPTQPPVGHAGH